MSLPRLTFICHPSWTTSICQIPDFFLTLTDPMQPPFSRWYNPDKRCDVMVGSSAISIEQLQESSPEVGEQETSEICEEACHWSFCHPNIIRITSNRSCSAKHRYCQKRWFKNGNELSIILLCNVAFFVLWSHLILERNMSFLCLPVVLKSRDASFKGYFYKIFWSSSNMWLRLINPED